jgi:hypothetical protein
LTEKPGAIPGRSTNGFFGKTDRLNLHRKSGRRVRTIAAGFAAMMHALFAAARLMVVLARVPQGLYMPSLFSDEGVFLTACITRTA